MKTLFSIALSLLMLTSAGMAQPLCQSWEEARQHLGKPVVIVGRYQPLPPPEPSPNSGIPGFKPGARPFGRAKIVLSDGDVFIDPPLHKTSLRSPNEREDYGDRWIQATGIPGTEGEPHLKLQSLSLDLRESKLYAPHSLLDEWSLRGLKHWSFVEQTSGSESDAWDLARTYRVQDQRASSRLTLFRFPGGEPGPPPVTSADEQVAYSTGGAPAHVGKIRLESEDLSAESIRWLMGTAFPLSAPQQAWLQGLDLGSVGQWEKEGVSVVRKPGWVELEDRRSLELRRDYLELEPRDRRR